MPPAIIRVFGEGSGEGVFAKRSSPAALHKTFTLLSYFFFGCGEDAAAGKEILLFQFFDTVFEVLRVVVVRSEVFR